MVWEEFRESKNDDGNKNKKRQRPLSEHDGATSVVYYSNGHAKWKMNPYKRGSWEKRWSRKASHRVTEDEKVGRWARRRVRPSTTQLPSVSLIITACVPAKITPFIHPRRVPALARSANSSLFSSSIHLSSILRCAMCSLPSISSSFGIVCLRNFTDALCTAAYREIIICNNTCGVESLTNRIKICSTYIVGD